MKILAAILLLQALAPPQQVAPVLEFPQAGLDDPAAYEGYRTRFFRDARGNAFQVYLNQRTGRLVNLWANAANESIGLTVRDASGLPARLSWVSDQGVVRSEGRAHAIEYRLRAEPQPLEIGWFMLGTMRVERDFQHQEHDRQPFGGASFPRPELVELIATLERLDSAEQRRQLALLNAASITELRERLQPTLRLSRNATVWTVRVQQPSFDGRNHLSLELEVDRREADVAIQGSTVSVRPRSNRPIHLTLRGTTDAAALTPLHRTEIFNEDFLHFVERTRGEYEQILRSAPEVRSPADEDRLLRFRRLDRQIQSVELLSYHEKLMAGLPNFATYFGRDMLMTALMMQPIWTGAMSEHVIASVLRKLAPSGEVSHEEALGGQAIRENAAVYNALMTEYFQLRNGGDSVEADATLARARAVLADLQAVRENYGNMMDDDFQFPVLVARYLADPGISAERKRGFLLEPAREGEPTSRLGFLLRNLAYVSRMAEPYAREPVVTNLVSFPRRGPDAWFPGSWRDSNAGYANGRFAMDINVIWVPAALEAIEQIVPVLAALGFGAQEIESLSPEIRSTPLAEHLSDPRSLRRAVQTWQGTAPLFAVRLSPEQVRERIQAKLSRLPEEERRYWQAVLETNSLGSSELEFLALSLDEAGQPIPVINTDPATHLLLEEQAGRPDQVLRDVRAMLLPYPAGLFVPELGPLVANDAYASPEVWEAFRQDHYHSPRVVWGREANLVILGIANQINAAFDASGTLRDPALGSYVRELHDALRRTVAAVEASGLKHNELWSYRIEGGRLLPVRYGASTDIQLWNLTDLAVQYELARIPAVLRAATAPSF